MSRESQSKLHVSYDENGNNLNFYYSKRGLNGAVGVRVAPEIVVGISPTNRVINWQINDPYQTLSDYLEKTDPTALKAGFYWKRALDQQKTERLLDVPCDTARFISEWIIGYSSIPYERR